MAAMVTHCLYTSPNYSSFLIFYKKRSCFPWSPEGETYPIVEVKCIPFLYISILKVIVVSNKKKKYFFSIWMFLMILFGIKRQECNLNGPPACKVVPPFIICMFTSYYCHWRNEVKADIWSLATNVSLCINIAKYINNVTDNIVKLSKKIAEKCIFTRISGHYAHLKS